MAPGPLPESSDAALVDAYGKTLLNLAAQSIRHGLAHKKPLPVDVADAVLRQARATFVTLEKHDALRGCIGSILPQRSLAGDVAANAFAAAFRDTRFSPVTAAELPELEVSISVLSPLEIIPARDEAELLLALRPHADGLLIQSGDRRAVFLPQVWEQLPAKADFLGHLKRKAGLPADPLPPGFVAQRFSVAEIAPVAIFL